MPAKLIDGTKIASEMHESMKNEIAELKAKGIRPKLVVVQVGRDASSTIYVEKKHKTCIELGMDSEIRRFGENTPYEEFASEIGRLNSDPSVHGFIIQSPLPGHLAKRPVFELVDIRKDADGWHPFNHGMNMLGKPAIRPATPKGIMALLESTGARLEGKCAVVVGRSNIVGKPVALMLINAGCTVTVCNSRTKKLADFTKKADILISAVGKPGIIKGQMVKKGAIVIDVGMSRGKDGRLKGDVDFAKARKKASYITPVPGGVGPMTIACLIQNSLEACRAIEWERLQRKN